MNESPMPSTDPDAHVSRTDLLISRLVDSEATSEEYDEFVARAEETPALWRAVVQTQRDRTALGKLMTQAATVAEGVDAPLEAGPANALGEPGSESGPASARRRSSRRRADRLSGGWVWAGWAVAAMLVLAWGVGIEPRRQRTAEPLTAAGVIPVSTARDAFDAYLRKGRDEGILLSEQPRRVLLRSRRMPDGQGYELIYLQQMLERSVVPDLFRVEGADERGRPSLVRYEQPERGPM